MTEKIEAGDTCPKHSTRFFCCRGSCYNGNVTRQEQKASLKRFRNVKKKKRIKTVVVG